MGHFGTLDMLQSGTPEYEFRGVFNSANRLGQLCAYNAPRSVIAEELKLLAKHVQQSESQMDSNPHWHPSIELLPPPGAYEILLEQSRKLYA